MEKEVHIRAVIEEVQLFRAEIRGVCKQSEASHSNWTSQEYVRSTPDCHVLQFSEKFYQTVLFIRMKRDGSIETIHHSNKE